MGCIHQQVCMFKGGEGTECPRWVQRICKYLDPAGKGVPSGKTEPIRKTKSRKGRKRLAYRLTTSKKDIARARAILKLRKDRGMLTEMQIKALDQYKGIRHKGLSEVQREQILSILHDSGKQD